MEKRKNNDIRIRRTFEKHTLENKSVRQAMKESGYSDAYAKNSHLLTSSKQWLDMMDKYGLTDETLLKRHNELVKSKREDIALRAVDMGYKVKGRYDQNKGTHFHAPVQIVIKTESGDNSAQ